MTRNSLLRKTVVVAGCAAFVGAVDVGIGMAASINANVSATVVSPIQISKVSDLSFGMFAIGAGGSLAIDTAGVLTPTGVTVVTSPHSAAEFTVTGQSGAGYAITLPAAVTLASGANNITVNTFTVNNGAGSGLTSTLTSGTDTLIIGATAMTPSGTSTGEYSGTLTVAVEYN